MEAKELVGEWIVVDLAETNFGRSGSTAFRAVGYTADTKYMIIDAGNWGWDMLDPDDIVIEKCEAYWYIQPENIIAVL